MAIGFGPFESHVFPNVYVQTNIQQVGGTPPNIRPLVIIGVGNEVLEQRDLELVRGSSATVDQHVANEDVSGRFVLDETDPTNPVLGPADGAHAKFQVSKYPIVTGDGTGSIANSSSNVQVTINDVSVAVAQVEGMTGEVTLQTLPVATDVVKISYYFKRTDTQITDDVSDQVTSGTADLTAVAESYVITSGFNDLLKLTVDGGAEATVTLMAGTRTALQIVADVAAAAISGLTPSVDVDSQGLNHVNLSANSEIMIGNGTANPTLGFTYGQSSGRNKAFQVFQRPVVDGSNGGVTTNDITKIIVKIDNITTVPVSLDGTNGIVTLALPPVDGSVVKITYYFNCWQDTFDYLPNTGIISVLNCGVAPGRNDYVNESDFVVEADKIYWGTAISVVSGVHSAGKDYFDDSQISSLLIDDRYYMALTDRYVDTSVSPPIISMNEFVLPLTPTTGNGRDTPLGISLYDAITAGRIDLSTTRPDLIVAYRGRNVRDALNRAPVQVISVDEATRVIKLATDIPPDENVYATFWYNRVEDNTYTLSVVTPGVTGVGTYMVHSALTDTDLLGIKFGTKSAGLSQTVQWPSGVEIRPDAITVGGAPVEETVTVLFQNEAGTPAIFTNDAPGPYNTYFGTSDQFRINVDNSGTTTVPLATTALASVVSTPIGTSINTVGHTAFNITVDAVPVVVTLASGDTTALSAIVTAINLASNASSLGADVAEIIGTGARSRLRIFSTTSPSGPDDLGSVLIGSGTANSVLGMNAGDSCQGSLGAVALPATMLSSVAGNYTITTGSNDHFILSVNGTSYNVTLTHGSRTAAQIASDINTATLHTNAVAVTIGANTYVRLLSHTFGPESSLVVGNGTANATLGFYQNESAGQQLPTALAFATVLNDNATLKNKAISRIFVEPGMGTYLQIESLTVGVTSSIAFVNGANSAFYETGLGITPGVSGDVGESTGNYFIVSSSAAHGSGSGANTGYPGQTYTDEVTGLRFTVLPSSTGSYTAGESFTLLVATLHKADVNLPMKTVAGVEMTVANTANLGIHDTAVLKTYNKSGAEPSIGDFYYLSYQYTKTNYGTTLFTPAEMNTIEALYGRISVENRLSLAANIAFSNGCQYIGLSQIKKEVNQGQASASAFIAAIKALEQPLEGGIRPYIIVVLTTDTSVLAYLEKHCAIQSSARYGARRLGYFGVASGTAPSEAQAIAKALHDTRMRGVYPDSAVISIPDENGVNTEQIVDGTFMAVALAASVMNPAIDMATPYENRVLVGFDRLGRQLDSVTQSTTAISGLNVLEDSAAGLVVKQGFTTDMSSLLVQIPTVAQIDDLMALNMANGLRKYIGIKALPGLPSAIESDANNVLKDMVSKELITGYLPATAAVDKDDPTLIRVEAMYAPVLPNLYILVTQTIRVSV